MSNSFCYLQVYRWRSVQAHYYGTLYFQGKVVRVLRKIMRVTAQQFNDCDGTTTYHAGEMSERFLERRQLVRCARRIYRKHFPQAVGLKVKNPALD